MLTLAQLVAGAGQVDLLDQPAEGVVAPLVNQAGAVAGAVLALKINLSPFCPVPTGAGRRLIPRGSNDPPYLAWRFST